MDFKSIATKGLSRASSVFLQDLQALPEEAFDASFGGTTRTVADIVYEVNLVNEDVARVLRGEKPSDWPEGWIKAPADFRAKEVVIKGFEESSAKVIAQVEALLPEELEGTVQTEQGETTRFQQCQFMTLHMWYHSGQLNFIQSLRGDDAWHWK